MSDVNIRALPPVLVELAAAELNETPNRISEDLKAIKEWLDKQPHIISRRDDQFLIAFLRGCKHSLERTKEKLDTFHAARNACPEIFDQRDPIDSNLRSILEFGLAVPLPKPMENNSRIFLCRPFLLDPNKYKMVETLKGNFMVGDFLLLEDDYDVIGGQTNIIDIKGLTMTHSLQMTATLIKKVVTVIQEGYPTRVKAFHFINASPAFGIIFQIFCQLLGEKLRNRVFVHTSLDDLYAHVPKSLLPEEYGGELESINKINDDLVQGIISKRQWYLDDVNYKTDESKREGAPKNANILFGVEGSFRKLEFD